MLRRCKILVSQVATIYQVDGLMATQLRAAALNFSRSASTTALSDALTLLASSPKILMLKTLDGTLTHAEIILGSYPHSSGRGDLQTHVEFELADHALDQ